VKPREPDQRAEPSPARAERGSDAGSGSVWEQVFERENLLCALRRVEANRGAPGIDGMTVQELRPYLREAWPEIKERLDAGSTGRALSGGWRSRSRMVG